MMRLIYRALPFIIIVIILYYGSGFARDIYLETRTRVNVNLTAWEMNSLAGQLDICLQIRPGEIRDFAVFVKEHYPGQAEKYSRDAWDTDYRYAYRPREKNYTLTSAGPDREFDTPDDMFRGAPPPAPEEF